MRTRSTHRRKYYLVNRESEHRNRDQQGCRRIIANLSSTGALLESRKPLGAVGENIVINAKFTVASIEKYLAIAAIIRNVRDKPHSDVRIIQHGFASSKMETSQ